MLVSKRNKDDIITLKLVTGEEVITKVIENKDDCLIVSTPFAFIMQKVGPAMAPMFLSVDWEKSPITIYKSAITMMATPKDEFITGYNGVSSNIVTPPKPKIIT